MLCRVPTLVPVPSRLAVLTPAALAASAAISLEEEALGPVNLPRTSSMSTFTHYLRDTWLGFRVRKTNSNIGSWCASGGATCRPTDHAIVADGSCQDKYVRISFSSTTSRDRRIRHWHHTLGGSAVKELGSGKTISAACVDHLPSHGKIKVTRASSCHSLETRMAGWIMTRRGDAYGVDERAVTVLWDMRGEEKSQKKKSKEKVQWRNAKAMRSEFRNLP